MVHHLILGVLRAERTAHVGDVTDRARIDDGDAHVVRRVEVSGVGHHVAVAAERGGLLVDGGLGVGNAYAQFDRSRDVGHGIPGVEIVSADLVGRLVDRDFGRKRRHVEFFPSQFDRFGLRAERCDDLVAVVGLVVDPYVGAETIRPAVFEQYVRDHLHDGLRAVECRAVLPHVLDGGRMVGAPADAARDVARLGRIAGCVTEGDARFGRGALAHEGDAGRGEVLQFEGRGVDDLRRTLATVGADAETVGFVQFETAVDRVALHVAGRESDFAGRSLVAGAHPDRESVLRIALVVPRDADFRVADPFGRDIGRRRQRRLGRLPALRFRAGGEHRRGQNRE